MRIITAMIVLGSLAFSQTFEYVGTESCKMCHRKAEDGDQYGKWSASKHAQAFEVLKSEAAVKIAQEKGLKTPAHEAPECLVCHSVGFGRGGYEVKDQSFWNPAADDRAGTKAVKRMAGLQGVGCEACHGPGSEYKSMKVMKDIHADTLDGKTVGLNTIEAATCTVCHNEKNPNYDKAKPFNYAEALKVIAHPYPDK